MALNKRDLLASDREPIDVFIGQHLESELVILIDQIDAAGNYDEVKCVIGCTNEAEALDLYASHYPDGWRVGPSRAMTMEQFKEWLAGDTTKSATGIEGGLSRAEVEALKASVDEATSVDEARQMVMEF